MHAGFIAAAHKKFFHTHFAGNFLERLFRVANRERYQNRARPRGNLVDVEPEPLGKQHDFGRNRGNSVVVVLPKEAQIDLGKGVDLGDAAHLKDLLAGTRESGMIRRVSRQLQAEVSFHRSADIRRAGSVDAPPSIVVLMLQNVISRLRKTLLIASTEKSVQQNVIRLKGGVSFQLAAPVAAFVLLRKQSLTSSVDTCRHAARKIIYLSEMQLRLRGYRR